MNLTKKINAVFFLFIFTATAAFGQLTQFNPDTVKAGRFDTGKMWTFDYPPYKYLQERYGFKATPEWFENVRLSALRIPGCTASFISGDGLILTNNHCATWHRDAVQKKGENLAKTGFYAKTLEEERKVPNMYVDRLVFIKDVTDEIQSAMDTATTQEAKIDAKAKKIEELQKKYSEETGLNCNVVSLFNGGKFSIYGYKHYTDVRLVFVPEQQIGYFGGDYDNFTYPRYDVDFSLFRVYEDGKPLQTEHYFKFSPNGAQDGEVIFTVGNPGRTNRLKTVSQLKYYRDVVYKNYSFAFDTYYNLLESLKSKFPERAQEFEKMKLRIGNAQKVFHYTYKGLANPYLMARKQAFENSLKDKVFADENLKNQFGGVWDAIDRVVKERTKYDKQITAFRLNRMFSSRYFFIARKLVKLAKQLKLPEDKRADEYKSAKLDSTIQAIFPDKFDYPVENAKLQVQADIIRMNLGDDNALVKLMFGDNHGKAAADYALKNSQITKKEDVIKLAKEGSEAILTSQDPFIQFILKTQGKLKDLLKKSKEAADTENILSNQLGRVMYEIYGTSIPPDANFTLRLSDGVLKSFDYNGTKAIPRTTFYGLYNRYFGAEGKYPWNLPKRWQTPPEGLDLSTPLNFISTNDIVGGNSGSAIINKNAEIVGLAFDGNVNSIIGNFIYMPKDNRCVAVASQAILAALKYAYKAERIVKEIQTGRIQK